MLAQTAIPIAQATQPAAGSGKELVDWFTLSAQIFNFLLLAFLLWFFLFRRVTKVMDRREKKIASHFEAAEQKDQEASEKAAAVEAEQQELQAKRDGMIKAAIEDAATQRRELEAEARKIVEREATQWREDLAREKQAFLAQMQTLAGEQVCQIARRALTDLADAELEGRMVDVLCKRLPDVPEKDRKALAKADGPLVVASAFELDGPARKKATDAVRKHVRSGADIDFEAAPELACGIEIRGGGHEIAWTVDGYVRGIHESLAAAIDEKIKAVPHAEPAEKPSPSKKKKAPKRKRPSRKKADAKSDDDE